MSQPESNNGSEKLKKLFAMTRRSGEFDELLKKSRELKKHADDLLRKGTSYLRVAEARLQEEAEQQVEQDKTNASISEPQINVAPTANAETEKITVAPIPTVNTEASLNAENANTQAESSTLASNDSASSSAKTEDIATTQESATAESKDAANPSIRTGIPSYVRGKISPELRQQQMRQQMRGSGKPQGTKPQNRFGQNQSGNPSFTSNRPASTSSRPTPLKTTPAAKPDFTPSKRLRDGKKEHDRNDDRSNKSSKRTLIRKGFLDESDESGRSVVRKLRNKKVTKVKPFEPIKIENAVITTDNLTVKILSETIGKTAQEIIKQLMQLGIMATINSVVDFATMQLVADALGVKIELKLEKTKEERLAEFHNVSPDEESKLISRPPIVAVMGHVDHGKTSLLDAIRQTSVATGEAGGITQHVGAYSVNVSGGRSITFLDTPGHEAFTQMRARGAKVTDIAIIIVAADDGVKPQTVEAIKHVQEAKVPIIVAINKIDKAGADPERVMRELSNYGLLCEEWGGDTVMVNISAKQKLNIDKLLENILFLSDYYNFRANPNREARGTVIEARLDKGRGPVANIIVENGTLHVGDFLVCGLSWGRVRALSDDKGRKVKSALPSMAVSVQGLAEVPTAGDSFYVVENEKAARQLIEERSAKQKTEMVSQTKIASLDDVDKLKANENIKSLNLIIKTEAQGSSEALASSLIALSNDEVQINVVSAGAGAINQSDVMMAQISKAVIIGFEVRPESSEVKVLAERNGIEIRQYSVIYDAINDVTEMMNSMLAPQYQEIVVGSATVRSTFKVSGVGIVAGCWVDSGKIVRGNKARLIRGGTVVADDVISGLKRFKDDAKEVGAGFECGISLNDVSDYLENDIIECYRMEVISAK